MLSVFVAIIVIIGHFCEVCGRSLGPGEVPLQRPDGRNVLENSFAFVDNQEELLDIQIQQFKIGSLKPSQQESPLLVNPKEAQSIVLVKTKTTRQRGKRYIRRAHLTPCLFKICKMGRKRHFGLP